MAQTLDEFPDSALQQLILSFVTERNRKVALIAHEVGAALESGRISFAHGLFDQRFDTCLAALAAAGQIECFGDLKNWRFSEVRALSGQ